MDSSNSLVAYFKDPYGDCCNMDNAEYKTDKQKFYKHEEEKFKRFLAICDKRCELPGLMKSNIRADIDAFFEKKHKTCKHRKRTLWQLLKLQLFRFS